MGERGRLAGKPATTKLLRLDMPIAEWEALDRLAAEHGMKIGLYVKRLLISHAQGDDATRVSGNLGQEGRPEPIVKPPTKRQWDALTKWLTATGREPDPALGITTKSGLMAWAIEQGFKP